MSTLTDPRDLRELLEQLLGATHTLGRELGGGGMSRLFLAEERALGRSVVVKVLSPELAHEFSAERFAREIQFSARLQHPNIVPVLTAGTAKALPYYVMPFIAGESLRARLARLPDGERLPLSTAIDVLRDVARALAYAHGMGIVHRDIKPENVLLAHDVAVVADFGVGKAMAAARTHEAPAGGVTLTGLGVALGTPAYMSPEQASGDPALDHRSDIYSWGVMAYELLAGVHPFAGRRSVHALVAAHIAEQPRSLAESLPEAAALSELVMRCLAKQANERPDSARELLDVLATVSTDELGQPRGAVPVRPVEVTNRAFPTQSRRAWFATTALILFMVAGAAIVRQVIGPGAGVDASTASISGPSAHDLYLRGKVQVSSENREDNEAAIATLRRAIQLDPELAPAHAELSRAYSIKAFYFAPDSAKKQLAEDAEVAVEKALSLDPTLGAAHFARGLMLWTPGRRFPHEQAARAYRQALAYDSTLDEAHHQLGLVYLHVGLLDEAQREIEKALAINPGNTMARFRLGVIDLYRHRFEPAYATFNSTPLEKNPTLHAFQTATALFRLGRDREATELIDQFLRDYPSDEGGVGHSVRAMMLARAGRRDEAEAAIAQALELGRGFGHFHHSAYNIASAYAMLGETGEAMRWLENAADDGFPCYPLFANDSQLDRLRGDARFRALMTRLERDWQERKRSF